MMPWARVIFWGGPPIWANAGDAESRTIEASARERVIGFSAPWPEDGSWTVADQSRALQDYRLAPRPCAAIPASPWQVPVRATTPSGAPPSAGTKRRQSVYAGGCPTLVPALK